METIEKKISNLIQSQFPAHYRENGPVFVAFVTEYYKWLESQDQTIYHTRRILDYKDIDETVDDFIIYFKNKYLTNIQFNTQSDIRQLVKHSLDLYRSKGTERSVDLLFRLVFGVGAEIYYPSSDIMKLSDGKWKKPTYLEVDLNNYNDRFSNKQIMGLRSGAKAFVEKVIRRRVSDRFIDVLYITNLTKDFMVNEILYVEGDDFLNKERIKIIGSLSEIDIDVNGVGIGYSIGDIVDLTSLKGKQGKGRVTNVVDINGLVTFSFENGGYGYNGNAQVIVSEKVLKLSNVVVNTSLNKTTEYFDIFETLTQPLANIIYSDLTGNTYIPVGSNIFTYHVNNSIKGSGVVLASSNTSSTTGQIRVSIKSGNLNDVSIYTQSNAISASIVTYTDRTATANIIGVGKEITFNFSNSTGTFEYGQEIYQRNSSNIEIANAIVNTFNISVGSNGVMRVFNTKGIFLNNLPIRNRSINSTANIDSMSFNIGVFDINSSFITSNNNYVYSSNLFTKATISTIGQGTGASFAISNDVLYTETLYNICTDYIKDYANVPLNSIVYGFPGNTAANLSYGTIGDALTIENIDIGKIRALTNLNRGTDYNISPFVLIYQPEIYHFRIRDSILNIANNSGNFTVGEIVEQSDTGARGIIKSSSNSSSIFIERLRFYNANSSNAGIIYTNFIPTVNTSTVIRGINSGFTANVVSVKDDANTEYLGLNAVVLSNTVTGNGSVTSMEIIDSGFGYVNSEIISFENEFGISTGLAVIKKQGVGTGYYKEKGGFLSDQKKLYDGYYYQDYSYDVRSSITLDKYSEMLKNVTHIAGTKLFGTLLYRTIANTQLNISSVIIRKTHIDQINTELNNLLMTEENNVLETES